MSTSTNIQTVSDPAVACTDWFGDPPCRICGRAKSEHHEFLVAMPPGCRCDPKGWCDVITPICANYEHDTNSGHCKHCEHDQECHTPNAAGEPQPKKPRT